MKILGVNKLLAIIAAFLTRGIVSHDISRYIKGYFE